MLQLIRQIATDLAARLGLLGPSTFHADVVRDFWGKTRVKERWNGEAFARRLVTSWMARRGASFPMRFVGFRIADGFFHRPTYINLTIHGFNVGPVDDFTSKEDHLTLIWSSPLFEDGQKQAMYWSPLDQKPLVPIID